jgi:succinoglycan biosynthesis transport protein ExoP
MAQQQTFRNTAKVQPTSKPEFSLLSLVRMLWKHKLFIVAVWSVVTLACVTVVWKLPAIYSAEAVVLVDAQKIPDRYVTSSVNTEVQDRLATITQEILSGPRLMRIADDFGLYQQERKTMVQEDLILLMRSHVAVKVDHSWTGGKAGAFRVGFEGPDPVVVAQVANRIAYLYVEENVRSRESQAQGTSEFIDTQAQEAKRKLDEMESALTQYKLRFNGELPEQENAIGQNLVRLQAELQNLRAAADRDESSEEVVKSSLDLAQATLTTIEKTGDPVRALALVNRLNPATPQAQAAPATRQDRPSDALEAELKTVLGKYGERHPEVRRLRGEIEHAKQLEKEQDEATLAAKRAAPQITPAPVQDKPVENADAAVVDGPSAAMQLAVGQARERVTNLKVQLASLEKGLASNRVQQQNVQKDIVRLQARQDQLPVREQDLIRLSRDYEITKSNYKDLLDKKMSAEMATDMERRQKSERFEIIDPARIAEKPFKPNRPLFAGIGSLIGLFLALALPLVKELHKGQFLGEWELPKGVPVLGQFPFLVIPARKRSTWPKRLLVSFATSAFLSLLLVGAYFLTGHKV